MKKILLAACALALAMFTASAIAAGAHTYSTHLRLSAKAPAFHGNVKSSAEVCRQHRLVRMFKKKDGKDKLLGTDRSEDNGDWKVSHPNLKSGIYYARVTKGGSASLGISCLKDKSRPVVVD